MVGVVEGQPFGMRAMRASRSSAALVGGILADEVKVVRRRTVQILCRVVLSYWATPK